MTRDHRHARRLFVAVTAFVLTAAACGGDDGSADTTVSAGATTAAPATTAGSATTAAPATTAGSATTRTRGRHDRGSR